MGLNGYYLLRTSPGQTIAGGTNRDGTSVLLLDNHVISLATSSQTVRRKTGGVVDTVIFALWLLGSLFICVQIFSGFYIFEILFFRILVFSSPNFFELIFFRDLIFGVFIRCTENCDIFHMYFEWAIRKRYKTSYHWSLNFGLPPVHSHTPVSILNINISLLFNFFVVFVVILRVFIFLCIYFSSLHFFEPLFFCPNIFLSLFFRVFIVSGLHFLSRYFSSRNFFQSSFFRFLIFTSPYFF